MSFDTSQQNYQDLRDGWKTRTRSIVTWVGAGLSAPANIPTWGSLRKQLILDAKALLRQLDQKEKRKLRQKEGLLRAAENDDNLWRSFSLLEDVLGSTSYEASVRRSLTPNRKEGTPSYYHQIWKLRPTGIVDLNLDGLSAQAHAAITAGNERLVQFEGKQIASRMHVLQTTAPWIARLHGLVEARDTWILNEKELGELFSTPGYQEFINTILLAHCSVFIGMSADDVAAGGHLHQLRSRGLRTGDHYWITHRSDSTTREWAENAGLRTITYESKANDHSQLSEILDDLIKFIPIDTPPPPIHPNTSLIDTIPSIQASLPDPSILQRSDPEEIRRVLNQHAIGILTATSTQRTDALEEYDRFVKKYNRAVALAWNVEDFPPDNVLFGYKIEKSIGEGAFGRVFEARDRSGKGRVAIKLLHDRVRRDNAMLSAFRRGVASMRILANHDVTGMVPYREAAEIPAMVVMDFVDGPSLTEIVNARQINDWPTILRISTDLVEIILKGHRLPERVLHRDIRPSNVMLDRYYYGDNWSLVVLDFDLSWHRDALDESIALPSAKFGYLAPEQLSRRPGVSTRNASVDSYGLGMTLRFLATGNHPEPGEHLREDWRSRLVNEFQSIHDSRLRCLGRRFANLVFMCTIDEQARRWDMSQIQSEIQALQNAEHNLAGIGSMQVLADELAARSMRLRNNYRHNNDSNSIVASFTRGPTVTLRPLQAKGSIDCEFSWTSTGLDSRKMVNKWIPSSVQQVRKILKRGHFTNVVATPGNGTAMVRGSLAIPLSEQQFDAAVVAVDTTIEKLTLT